jgi:hypothetical protein
MDLELSVLLESMSLCAGSTFEMSIKKLTFNLSRPPILPQSPMFSSLDSEACSLSASRTSLKHKVHVMTMLRRVSVPSSM